MKKYVLKGTCLISLVASAGMSACTLASENKVEMMAETELDATTESQDYLLPEAESKVLGPEDVEGWSAQVLVYARNEILARYGMIFKSPELNGYFTRLNWYFGFIDESTFPTDVLSDTVKENLKFLDEQIAVAEPAYVLDQPDFNYEPVQKFLAGEIQPEVSEETETEIVTEEADSEAETEGVLEEAVSEAETEEADSEAETEGVSEEAVSEVETEEITEEADSEAETEEVTEEAVSEVETEEITEEAASEAETEEVTEEAVSEVETEEITEEAASEAETEEVTEEADSEAETKEVTEESVSEVETEAVTEEADSEAETEGVSEEAVSEAETGEVTEEAVSEVETEEAIEEAVSEAETEEVTEEAVSEVETEEATEEADSEAETEEVTEESVSEVETEEATEEALSEVETEEATEEAVSEAETEEVTEEAVSEATTLENMRYILPEAETKLLDPEDVEGWPAQLLVYARNEILARSGMDFESPELEGYFTQKDWYFGFIDEDIFPIDVLSEIEQANLTFLDEQIAIAEPAYVLDQPGFNYETVQKYFGTEIQQEGFEEAETETVAVEAVSETETEEVTEEAMSETETEEVTEVAVGETEFEEATEIMVRVTETGETTESEPSPPALPEEKLEAPETEKSDSGLGDLREAMESIFHYGSFCTPNRQVETVSVQEYEYIFPDVDRRYLSRAEVEVLSLQAVCYAKNEIYARHGRKFVSYELQQYFGEKSWYFGFVSPEEFSDRVFNDFEVQNILLLVEREEALRPGGYLLDQAGYDIHAVNTGHAVAGYSETVNGECDPILLNDYVLEESDIRSLTQTEVGELSREALTVAACEIFARKGYSFEDVEIQDYFNQKYWYHRRLDPSGVDAKLFNEIELSNLEMILTALKNQ